MYKSISNKEIQEPKTLLSAMSTQMDGILFLVSSFPFINSSFGFIISKLNLRLKITNNNCLSQPMPLAFFRLFHFFFGQHVLFNLAEFVLISKIKYLVNWSPTPSPGRIAILPINSAFAIRSRNLVAETDGSVMTKIGSDPLAH